MLLSVGVHNTEYFVRDEFGVDCGQDFQSTEQTSNPILTSTQVNLAASGKVVPSRRLEVFLCYMMCLFIMILFRSVELWVQILIRWELLTFSSNGISAKRLIDFFTILEWSFECWCNVMLVGTFHKDSISRS